MIFRLLVCLLLTASGVLRAEPVRFTEGPVVQRRGEGSSLTFALSERADIEISILDARGKVVRHLAAGVLGGERPPPPPLAKGLRQSIEWDGKDDAGARARGSPFHVRVRAGMQVKFGRMIGGDPTTGGVVSMPYRAPVNGLALDAKGQLLVKMMSSVGSHGNSGMWPWHVRRFDRRGRYVRTLLPYPPSTLPAHASGVELLDTGSGFTPANRTSLYPVFADVGNEVVHRTADKQLVFVHSEKRRLEFLSLDETNRIRHVTMWPAKAKLVCPRWLDIQVALSPDSTVAYYSNVAGTAYDGKQPSDIDPRWPQGRVYRHDLTRPESIPQPFFDLSLPDFDAKPYWMPSAWDKKTAAAGIDTDARGNVLCCDLVNGQVVEISPEGKQLSATAVAWPDKVIVHRKSGDLYVISRKVSRGALPPAKLLKITGRGRSAKVVATLDLAGTIGGAYTLDERGDVPVLWLAGSTRSGDKLLRIEDRGAEFVIVADDILNGDANAISFAGYLDVDREADLVYITGNGPKVWRFDGRTGQGGLLEIRAVDLAIGPGGHVYTWGTDGGYEGPIARYTRDLAPAPLASTGEHTYGSLYGRAGRGRSVCGMDVDRLGRVFATYGVNECHVRAYDASGDLVDFPRKITIQTRRGSAEVPVAISGVSGYGGSIRLDPQGNIYLLQQGLAEDHVPPAGFENDEAYRRAVGTIHKFAPGGGEIESVRGSPRRVVGALASYAGCGPISRWRAVGSCACTKPRFDVDDFGRLYIPNAITFSVSIRDNADNEILRFGGYGNFDCQGPSSREGRPEIPLGWPVAVGASDAHVYVGDSLNHRVVRVDRTYAAVATVEVK